ncbi:MAG: T9SS type A sorting domain-containing protein [Flavobacteriales bacterium]|nr:T9SS type A sorting domain-containing protein [Flavobacteriales bacterium]
MREQNGLPTFALWPHPTTGILFVEKPDPEAARFEVYDGLGRLIITLPFSDQIDVSVLPMGAYVALIRSFDGKPLARARFTRA